MKKGSKLALFLGVVAAVAAVVAALSALLLYLDKKKDDEELEHYLDCSIQSGVIENGTKNGGKLSRRFCCFYRFFAPMKLTLWSGATVMPRVSGLVA